uniref:Uncharacterized protein n=1 Tax=Chrysotila carterae TaxID=13221 RepID=A0A7S4B2K0_CHRCT|mmetsp:Transcript_11675/g.25068  ORF Transcript_11675/g.25068 Transcript_11675/m.25068 type:complete len:150 (+) Transcript_11675:372-821(+)
MSDVPKSPRVNGAQTSAYYMTPGPGAYPIKMDQKAKGLIGDAPAFTMSQRFGVAGAGEQSPGPAYVLKATSPRSDGPMGESSPRYSFGTQGRFYKETASVPGPGHYPQGTSIGGATKVGFGSEKQRPPSDTNKGVAYAAAPHEHLRRMC